jgi:unsaturated rhamnogalacturonyl hydrolase
VNREAQVASEAQGETGQTVRSALLTVAATLLALPYETWNFGDSVAFDAMLEVSAAVGDATYARFAHGWARAWATRALPYRRLDCTAPGHAMVRLSRLYNDSRLLTASVGLADYLMSRPRIRGVFATWEHSPLVQPYGPDPLDPRGAVLAATPPPGVFVDCLHFDPPFFTSLGELTASELYMRVGLEQARGYVELLQGVSGLFDHFVLEGEPGSFGPGWGRGQGWALLGLLDVVETARRLPGHESQATVDLLSDAVAKLIAAMVKLQRADGHWYAVVDHPSSRDEHSTAAFMACGISRALRMGLVSGSSVAKGVERAREAVLRSITPDGMLQKVSAAVMACTQASHYYHVPTDFLVPWGQGPAALALTEALHGG